METVFLFSELKWKHTCVLQYIKHSMIHIEIWWYYHSFLTVQQVLSIIPTLLYSTTWSTMKMKYTKKWRTAHHLYNCTFASCLHIPAVFLWSSVNRHCSLGFKVLNPGWADRIVLIKMLINEAKRWLVHLRGRLYYYLIRCYGMRDFSHPCFCALLVKAVPSSWEGGNHGDISDEERVRAQVT